MIGLICTISYLVFLAIICKQGVGYFGSLEMSENIEINNKLERQFKDIVYDAVRFVEQTEVSKLRNTLEWNDEAKKKALKDAINYIQFETDGTILEQKSRNLAADVETTLFDLKGGLIEEKKNVTTTFQS